MDVELRHCGAHPVVLCAGAHSTGERCDSWLAAAPRAPTAGRPAMTFSMRVVFPEFFRPTKHRTGGRKTSPPISPPRIDTVIPLFSYRSPAGFLRDYPFTRFTFVS